MIAKIAYLTSPAPERYILNFQSGDDDIITVEISKAHLANILIDGLSFSLRQLSTHRVSQTTHTGDASDRATTGA